MYVFGFQDSEKRASQMSNLSAHSDISMECAREKACSVVEGPTQPPEGYVVHLIFYSLLTFYPYVVCFTAVETFFM